MSVCVYALTTRGDGRPGITGIAGERLRRIRAGTVDAIVGTVTRMPAPTHDNLRRYHRVLTALWAGNPTLLPVRFGSTVPGEAELKALIEATRDTLRERLALVRQRAQMTVRIVRGSPDPRSPVPDPRSPGRSYLRARARAADVPEFAPLRQAVQRWVKAERIERRATVATMYHLVPRNAASRYRTAIERAAAHSGVRLVLSGPWPPFAFADAG